MCRSCNLAPSEVARIDQVIAAYNADLDRLIKAVAGELDAGEDAAHAAAFVVVTATRTRSAKAVAALLGHAVVRLAQQQRATTDSGDGEPPVADVAGGRS